MGATHSSLPRDLPRAERIARLNDQLRTTLRGGRFMITRGVSAHPDCGVAALADALKCYDEFDADNDPHGERDFGAFDLGDAELLWKIDYYDRELVYASPDPADANVTVRVLTVMLAEEY